MTGLTSWTRRRTRRFLWLIAFPWLWLGCLSGQTPPPLPALPTFAPLAQLPDNTPAPTTAPVTLPTTPLPPTFTPAPPSLTPVPQGPAAAGASLVKATPTAPPPTATPTATSGATAATPSDQLASLPAFGPAGTPHPYLTRIRLVAYYGSATGPGLGILGDSPRPVMLADLQRLAAVYQALSPDRTVLPTYHIVTTVADSFPGKLDHYSHQISLDLIESWVAAAAAADVAVILDIQPGYADIAAEIGRIAHLLREPHVQLALDPEFIMANGQIPGYQIGQIDAAQINEAQATLNEIALEIGINKVLLIHQFQPAMVINKAGIIDYPHVELVLNADGFGGPGAKIGDYNQHAAAPAFEHGGLKLFFEWDYPLMAPAAVLGLSPPPAIVIYQ